MRRMTVGQPARVLEMQREHVLGDRQSDARAAELRCVHVSVNPGRGSLAVRIGADRRDEELSAFGARADALDANELRMLGRPGAQDVRDLGVTQVLRSEARHGLAAYAPVSAPPA